MIEKPILLDAKTIAELKQYLEKIKVLAKSLSRLRDSHGVAWSKNQEILIVSCTLTSRSDFTQHLETIKAHQAKFPNWSIRVGNSKYTELFDFKSEPHSEDPQITIFSFKAAPSELLVDGKLPEREED